MAWFGLDKFFIRKRNTDIVAKTEVNLDADKLFAINSEENAQAFLTSNNLKITPELVNALEKLANEKVKLPSNALALNYFTKLIIAFEQTPSKRSFFSFMRAKPKTILPKESMLEKLNAAESSIKAAVDLRERYLENTQVTVEPEKIRQINSLAALNLPKLLSDNIGLTAYALSKNYLSQQCELGNLSEINLIVDELSRSQSSSTHKAFMADKSAWHSQAVMDQLAKRDITEIKNILAQHPIIGDYNDGASLARKLLGSAIYHCDKDLLRQAIIAINPKHDPELQRTIIADIITYINFTPVSEQAKDLIDFVKTQADLITIDRKLSQNISNSDLLNSVIVNWTQEDLAKFSHEPGYSKTLALLYDDGHFDAVKRLVTASAAKANASLISSSSYDNPKLAIAVFRITRDNNPKVNFFQANTAENLASDLVLAAIKVHDSRAMGEIMSEIYLSNAPTKVKEAVERFTSNANASELLAQIDNILQCIDNPQAKQAIAIAFIQNPATIIKLAEHHLGTRDQLYESFESAIMHSKLKDYAEILTNQNFKDSIKEYIKAYKEVIDAKETAQKNHHEITTGDVTLKKAVALVAKDFDSRIKESTAQIKASQDIMKTSSATIQKIISSTASTAIAPSAQSAHAAPVGYKAHQSFADLIDTLNNSQIDSARINIAKDIAIKLNDVDINDAEKEQAIKSILEHGNLRYFDQANELPAIAQYCSTADLNATHLKELLDDSIVNPQAFAKMKHALYSRSDIAIENQNLAKAIDDYQDIMNKLNDPLRANAMLVKHNGLTGNTSLAHFKEDKIEKRLLAILRIVAPENATLSPGSLARIVKLKAPGESSDNAVETLSAPLPAARGLREQQILDEVRTDTSKSFTYLKAARQAATGLINVTTGRTAEEGAIANSVIIQKAKANAAEKRKASFVAPSKLGR